MKEQRKHRRFKLKEHTHVLDAASGKFIGNIIDISEDGFKMVTPNKIKQGEECLFKIALPPVNGKKEFIDVKARVQWCVKKDDIKLSTMGCYIVQVNVLGRLSIANYIIETLKNN